MNFDLGFVWLESTFVRQWNSICPLECSFFFLQHIKPPAFETWDSLCSLFSALAFAHAETRPRSTYFQLKWVFIAKHVYLKVSYIVVSFRQISKRKNLKNTQNSPWDLFSKVADENNLLIYIIMHK